MSESELSIREEIFYPALLLARVEIGDPKEVCHRSDLRAGSGEENIDNPKKENLK